MGLTPDQLDAVTYGVLGFCFVIFCVLGFAHYRRAVRRGIELTRKPGLK